MADLGQRTAAGGAIAIGAQVVRLVLRLAAAVVMARLLAPEDFGLVAMATTVTAFVGIFTDLGLSAATVQRKEIDHDTVSALFYVNLATGALLMLATIAAAPIAAWGFGDERVSSVVIALAATIPLVAASAQHNALLQRGMRWMTIQWTGIAAQAAGAAVGILLAWRTDAGYWALVAQAWAAALAGLVLVWIACPWRPGRVANWAGARSALSFGLNLTGFNLLNYFHRQFDNVLVGWRWGATDLGYYTRAYMLFMLPLTGIVWPVAAAVIPAMSRLQHEPERWRRLYLTSIAGLMVITAPLSGLLVLFAEPLVLTLFGAQWAPSAPIF
ncbi:MAG TPA: lipopolysaccharide biosynthesis protein, partial [Kiloniellales bacterium]